MTELRNVEVELTRFRIRVLVVGVAVLVCFVLLAARLVFLQVVRHDDLRAQAESNRTSIVPIVPNRGLIVDRNGIVLASNYSAYTLEITPSRTLAGWEATADELSKVLDVTARDRRRFKKLLDESKSFESLPIRTRLTDTEVARFAAQRFRFPGVEIKARLFRNYPYGELASHVIGYIGRINQAEKTKIDRYLALSVSPYSASESAIVWKSAPESTKTMPRRPTTGAPNTWASWVWSRASKAPCMALPAWSGSKRPPVAVRCANSPARTRPQATW